jgi:hypothetical protein
MTLFDAIAALLEAAKALDESIARMRARRPRVAGGA